MRFRPFSTNTVESSQFIELAFLLFCFGLLGFQLLWATPLAAEHGTENSVDVTLTEYQIDMPATLSAGWTTFKITNSGKKTHSFKIKGNGLEKKLKSHLKPGQSASLQVELRPGNYRVSCPEDNHDKDKNMKLEVRVNP